MPDTVSREEFQDHLQALAIQREMHANNAALLHAELTAAKRKIAALEAAAKGNAVNLPSPSPSADSEAA